MEGVSSAETGLSETEARRRLESDGPNEPAPGGRTAFLSRYAPLLTNPLVLLLVVASGVSAALGQIVQAGLVFAMVTFSVVLNAVQMRRSEKVTDALRRGVAPTAVVLRDGAFVERPRAGLVRGDVIRLAAGDLVPADARLLASRDLHVQQAALTGESLPVEKDVAPAGDPRGDVFLGTSVASGTATALVTATGPRTAFGAIAQRLARRPPETEFERGTRHFGLLVMRTVVFLVLFVFLVSAALHRDPLQSLLFAVALAVGLTPEFLPMITTVTLGQGARRMARKHVVVKTLGAIQNLGSIDVLLCDKTGTLTSGALAVSASLDARGAPSERPLALARLNAAHETGVTNPLDAALLAAGSGDAATWVKRDEVPFDFERRRVTIVLERGGERLLIVKGAPEGVLRCCTMCEGPDGAPRPLTPEAEEAAAGAARAAGARGERVLAVASRAAGERSAWRAEDERDLVLAGYVTFRDPPHPDAKGALAALRRDGVEVKLVSGDEALVVRHVAGEVGLGGAGGLLGDEIDGMTDGALGHVAERVSVFARVSPVQKHRILLALKARGHVVGFLGDGINDAPSLHAADVGIAAPGAVDVARDAADVILLAHGLRVIHQGILSGRRAFANIVKYLLMGTSSNFGNMFSMAVASLFLPFLPMLPTQVLLNNFLYDLAQVTIPTDHVDPAFVLKPRRWDVRLVRDFMVTIGPISSIYDFLTFWVLLSVFHAGKDLFRTGWFVESLATQTLVIFVIRTAASPLKSRPSRALAATTLAVVAAGILLPYAPFARFLGFVPMPPAFLLFLAAATVTYLGLVELAKRRLFRRGLVR